jgi:hypothetical protein
MAIAGPKISRTLNMEVGLLAFLALFLQAYMPGGAIAPFSEQTAIVRRTDEFEISGDGSARNWANAKWILLPQQKKPGVPYETRAKMMYSASGLYLLFFCEDRKITATMQSDFSDLWNEDVIEVFLQPNPLEPSYFEYELSPLNYELPIAIFNDKGNLNSWIPFHYDKERKTQHKTVVQQTQGRDGARVQSWTAEIFIPYLLLAPVMKGKPVSGTRWRGNLNRIDYDEGEALWAWQRNSGDFHEYDKFGVFQFE